MNYKDKFLPEGTDIKKQLRKLREKMPNRKNKQILPNNFRIHIWINISECVCVVTGNLY